MRKFNKNKYRQGQGRNNQNRYNKKPNRKFQRPVKNFRDMHPSEMGPSESLLASFTHRTVRRRPGESTEALLKRFKTVVEKSGVISEVKRREYYKSRGEKAREKMLKARKRARKNMQKRRRFD